MSDLDKKNLMAVIEAAMDQNADGLVSTISIARKTIGDSEVDRLLSLSVFEILSSLTGADLLMLARKEF